jgi:hypothetical protein
MCRDRPNAKVQLQEEGLREEPHRLLRLLLAPDHTFCQLHIRRYPLQRHYSPTLAYPASLEAQLVCFFRWFI